MLQIILNARKAGVTFCFMRMRKEDNSRARRDIAEEMQIIADRFHLPKDED